MRLKEAQLLGILAIIAVLIIVLCMWSGGSEPEDVAALGDAEGTVMSEPPGAETPRAEDLVNDFERYWQDDGLGLREGTTSDAGGASIGLGGSDADVLPEPLTSEPQPVGPPRIDPEPDSVQPIPSPPRPVTPSLPLKVHVVKQGDNLWNISKQYYGTAGMSKVKAIHEANKALIRDPRRDLQPGMRLVIPRLGDAQAATGGGRSDGQSLLSSSSDSGTKSYIVQKNDTLWGIAETSYGDPEAWKKILAANAGLINRAEDLRTGMCLTLP